MNRISTFAAAALSAVLLSACKGGPELIPASNFVSEIDGVPIGLFTLHNGDITAQVTNFGARVVSLYAPDREGKLEDIVVGHDNIDAYVEPSGERFFGAVVGPVANRIGKASFTVDGQVYNTPVNDHDANTLHGGILGVDMLPWSVVGYTDSSISLALLHPDGLEGYPGNLRIALTYSLLDDNSLKIEYTATTDRPCPVNLTSHPFFCLRGEGNGSVEEYMLQINASSFIPIDSESIPTGGIAPVEGTPFDFREPHLIGERIGDYDEQLVNGRGYDHNWCIDREGDSLEELCRVTDPLSGRSVAVISDRRGLQFYSGNFFDGSECGKNGKPLSFRSSLALEAQDWPDTPNNPVFGDITLRPGEEYSQTTVYKFSVL